MLSEGAEAGEIGVASILSDMYGRRTETFLCSSLLMNALAARSFVCLRVAGSPDEVMTGFR